jgi:hypothetical protein
VQVAACSVLVFILAAITISSAIIAVSRGIRCIGTGLLCSFEVAVAQVDAWRIALAVSDVVVATAGIVVVVVVALLKLRRRLVSPSQILRIKRILTI